MRERRWRAFSTVWLGFGFSVVQMPMLPVEPGMAQFMSEDVAPPGQRQSLAQVNRLVVIVPDPVGVRIASIHLGFGQLPHRNVITEGEYDSSRNSQHRLLLRNAYQRITKADRASRYDIA